MWNVVAFGLLPLAMLIAALAPMYGKPSGVADGDEEHARRLIGQASVMSDLRPGRAVVRSMVITDREKLYAAQGTVEWVGPFGITVLEVEVAERSQRSSPYPVRATAAWGGLLAGVLAGPVFVVWKELRT